MSYRLRVVSSGERSFSYSLIRNSQDDNKDKEMLSEALLSALENLESNEKNSRSTAPNMWTKEYIGLYCQYAGVGLLYGMSGTFYPFCNYHFVGRPNVCANSNNIVFFAWSLKIIFAVITDSFHPFGMRRKPWMLFGWSGVLIILALLVIFVDDLDANTWLASLLLMQVFLMFSDVPADGLSVELGQMEAEHERGQILATGQRIRFTFCIIAGMIQTFLLNGPTTNADGCKIAFADCWSWGLTVKRYYALLFILIVIIITPILFLKELPNPGIKHSFSEFRSHMWEIMQNLTTLYLIVFVIGIGVFTNFTSNVNIYLQYNIIQLTNFEAGIDTITTYVSVVGAIYLFQKYLINSNWRMTQYCSTIFSGSLGALWILAYYNVGGTRDPWFTIFVDLDQNFAAGLSQVLFSMAVIELAKPGLESTTYELIVTVANSALTVSGILCTQLLTPLRVVACTDEPCSSKTVDVTSVKAYEDSDGPFKYTIYALVLICMAIFGSVMFTPFLPASKEECRIWKRQGDAQGISLKIGITTLTLSLMTITYGIIVACLLLNTSTSCLEIVGGSGCGSDSHHHNTTRF